MLYFHSDIGDDPLKFVYIRFALMFVLASMLVTGRCTSTQHTWVGSPQQTIVPSVDDGITQTQINTSTKWSPRFGQSSVVMPDGSIVLIGGETNNGYVSNDVWRSEDMGNTWTQLNSNPGWLPQSGQSYVILKDGSIVLIGGAKPNIGDISHMTFIHYNEVWRSTDAGTTWTLINASVGGSPRGGQNCLVMPDGNIILLGGRVGGDGRSNDVWRSKDGGATWTMINDKRGWSPRYGQSSVVMPDGSIVLMGGWDGEMENDVYRSTDEGAHWSLVSKTQVSR